MKDTYRNRIYPISLAVLMFTALWQCNIEVGNPDSNLPESMRSVQNLSFNLSVGAACTTSADTCVAVPVVLPEGHSPSITYEMTGVGFQLSGLQLKPNGETPLWTQLDLLHGSSVVLPESINSASVTAIALKFQAANSPGASTFEIFGNLVVGAGSDRVILPLKLVFDNQLMAETAVASSGALLDGVEFNGSAWFDFSDTKGDFSHIFKGVLGGACRTPDSAACTQYRDSIARQVSRRISRSMTVKTHPVGKSGQQKFKSP